ncbi:hypothetical protein IVB03_03625 [Bradyrhizobium sp. 168]|uniref:hypothetical protein n=1 Tax=Bradyrhizobium sp. 168 TaxID=2782639 RepID=UPI001FFB3E65|nr:hypothetical protein [Bradyrhizobium sp. 168]MCK1578697.1 hypothetical protein [Bradyrhizobium sp. 168]
MTDLEDLIVKEASRQGRRANQDAVRQAGIDLAGATMTSQGLINLPGRGCIAPADFVRDLHNRIPEAFAIVADEGTSEATAGNLTERMRQEVAATRRERALPSDWLAVRSKATGITAQHMAERESNWK